MSVPHAAGAIRSTANDLVRWHTVLAGEDLLSAESKAQLYRAEKSNYAYGWVVDTISGHTRIGHNGGVNGFESFYARLPDEDIVVVAWTNHEGFPVTDLGEAALRFAIGEPVPPHAETPVVELDVAVGKRVAGGYVVTDASRQRLAEAGLPPHIIESFEVLELRLDGDILTLDPFGEGEPSFRMFASGPTTFFIKNPPVEISVAPSNVEGQAAGLTVRQTGLEVQYTRDARAAKKARKASTDRTKKN